MNQTNLPNTRSLSPSSRWYVSRVKLSREGYDASGAYYGTVGGLPLWQCMSADGMFSFRVRGHKDYARFCYMWARQQPDIAAACQHIDCFGGRNLR